jgi:beta-galactosidase
MRRFGIVSSFAVCLFLAAWGGAAEYAWLEGETPTSKNVEAKASGWGNKQFLSSETWLHLSLSVEEIAKTLPKDGALFGYGFTIRKAAQYEVWGRIGFELARSPFEWRLDAGEWKTILPSDLTADLMRIEFWCEVAWLKFGDANLTEGKHSLQVRILPPFKEEKKKQRDKDGKEIEAVEKKPDRILYAADCFCIHEGPFRPNSRFKPDEAWQTEEDKRAAAHVFEVKPAAKPDERAVTSLAGLWQACRYDEQAIEDRTGPIKAIPDPEKAFWMGIQVPGDKDKMRPELIFCHRFFCRTRVRVPAEMQGRSFFLHFPDNCMITTVHVNGVLCGWTKAPHAAWDCDITKALKPGQANELWVGIKDTYYGTPEDTRRKFNAPMEHWSASWFSQALDFPVWNHYASGMVGEPSLVSCGPAYAADVFAVPSVQKKQLGLEVTLMNPTGADLAVTVDNEVVPLEGGKAEKTFAAANATVPAGKDHVLKVAEPWESAKLWWPDAPQQYIVVTKVSVGGKPVDVTRTKFGFREWEWSGPGFKLNGVPWLGRADTSSGTPEVLKKHGQNMTRLWGGPMPDKLDEMDKAGMPVRRTGIFDGEGGNYNTTSRPLFENWREQVRAWVREERNHPCIFIWSLENEVTYINSRNWGTLAVEEPEIKKCAEMVMAMDPTRPVMVDGGRALMDKSLPVYGCHYEETAQRDYPDEAYTLEKGLPGKLTWQVWPMDRTKPILMGESFFARGYPPSWFAGVSGETAFLGRTEAARGVGLFAKMLSEGYRWAGVNFHFWFGDETTIHYNSWQDVCVLCRQWDWTFGGGTTVPRTLRVFNDTHYPDPIEAAWELRLGRRVADSGKKTCAIAPGMAEDWEIAAKVPTVTSRTQGEFILTCARKGKEVYREVKPVAVIPQDRAPKPLLKAADPSASLRAGLLVLDPSGSAKARLTQRRIAFTEVARFEDLPEQAKVIVVGKDALTARQATDPKWRALAASGARVLVLEQRNPLHYLAVPADFEVTDYVGRIAFPENPEHPIFEELGEQDFFTWSKDNVVYRNVYKKATRGATSLVQCDEALSCSALAACPVNDGLLLLCQLVVGDKLDSDPVAQLLFDNLLNYAAAYKPVRKATAVAIAANTPEGKLLAASGLKFDTVPDVVAALGERKHEIVVASATPDNLRKLAAAPNALKAFTARGGWLMLWGLSKEGLEDFNRVVGVEHMVRPFEMERVSLAAVRDPLASGLTMRDVVMESGQQMFGWAGDRFMADDVFTSVVDVDDVAPFCTVPNDKHFGYDDGKPGWDHWPRNMFNGFTTSDSWKYVFTIVPARASTATKWTMAFPREIEVADLSIVFNAIYQNITKFALYFDDDPKPVTLDAKPGNERQDFPLPAPRKAKTMTVELVDWTKGPDGKAILGVDNMWIRIKRPSDFAARVKPLLNIGALVKYPMGRGGILLNNLRILDKESVPVNAQKKQAIVATLLQNMGATFSGGRVLVAGAGMTYAPIELGDKCNQFLTRDKGWFDSRDLSAFPKGENKLAGVTCVIRDFKTSPLPSCIMLAGPGVKGDLSREVKSIPVGKKADALFFLHAFKRARDWRPPREGDKTPPILFQYTAHYADGKTAEVPVRYGEGADHWISKEPRGLKDAAVAWAAAFPNDSSGDQAVVYQFQWNNPRPEAEIKDLDLTYHDSTKGEYGVPALLALTAATAIR